MPSKTPNFSQTPLLEWIAGGAGLVFLIGLLGVIGYGAVTGTSGDLPAVAVRTGGMARTSAGYVVAFDAINVGARTAAALAIEGQLLDGATVVETSSATIDYVPANGRAQGGLFFLHDPKGLTIKARPLGYQAP